MTIDISTRASATTPSSATEVTLFLDSENNNALTAKYYDNTFKTLSGDPAQFSVAEPLTEFIDNVSEHLTCAVNKGTITLTDFQTYVNSLNLYYQSNIDSNGNLNQSVTTTPPSGVSASEFSVGYISPVSAGKLTFAITSTTPSSTAFYIDVDRNGIEGDIAYSVAFPTGVSGITMATNSYEVNSLGVTTANANEVAEGTSSLIGLFDYDGTAISAATYTAVITLIAGTVVKYIPVEIVVS